MLSAPRSVEIAGPLKHLEFPPVCANCGNATSESLEVAKVFVRGDPTVDRRSNTYPIVRVNVPFCPPCMARHQAEAQRIGGLRRFLLSFHNGAALAGLGAFGVGLLFLYETTVLPRSRSLLLELAAVCLLLAWAGFRIAYFYTERLAI